MKRLIYITLAVCLLQFNFVSAQGDLDQILKGSLSDAKTLVEGYIGPAMKGLGEGLNYGWYNTAKVHKTLGIDFTITTSLMYIPKGDELYTVDNSKLQQVKLISYDGQTISPTGSGKVPTLFGPDKTPTYQIAPAPSFSGPPGLDLKNSFKLANALPVPMYHLAVGLPKGFDLKVRWSPRLDVGDLSFNLFGIGVMHDVKQYIPGIKALPFDLSGFVGYTRMKAEVALSGLSTGQNQRALTEFNSTTIQALISKKIAVMTIYGGIGYNFAKSNLAMKGTYDLDDDGTPEATDPVNLEFSTSGPRLTGGLRLKLAVFTFHCDYTVAKYKALSGGFGINIR